MKLLCVGTGLASYPKDQSLAYHGASTVEKELLDELPEQYVWVRTEERSRLLGVTWEYVIKQPIPIEEVLKVLQARKPEEE